MLQSDNSEDVESHVRHKCYFSPKIGLLTAKNIFCNDEVGTKSYDDQKMAVFCITLGTKYCNELSWPLDGTIPSH